MKKVLSIGSALLLCGGSVVAALAQPSTPESKPVVPKQAPPPRPYLELLAVGRAPQQVLRFKPALNTKQTATMTMGMDMGLAISGQPVPIYKLPGTVMTFETLVDRIDPNGDIHYQFQYTNVDVVEDSKLPSEQLNKLRTQLQKLKGIRGRVVADNRGQTKSGKFELSTELDSANKQMLKQITNSVEQLSSPVPEPALGVGAKWRVISAPKFNGITLKQVATYELLSFQEGGMTLRVTLDQKASPQQMNATGLPSGKILNLKSLVGTGQGQTVVKLDRLIPIDSNMTAQLRSEMVSPNSPKMMYMTTNTKMKLTLKSQ
ncbi:hypothetical protein [Altericista sp. CCNU0014]|uniref:hypothetical protein n=1 Tax=Altericista sp. CCNU0014 TaxID=3082949 RepID=UPI00384B57BC